MTDAQHAAYQTYLRQLADLLGLKDWEIVLKREPDANEDAAASITCTYGQKHAFVWVGPAFFSEFDVDYRRRTLIHELIHCHLNPIQEVVGNLAGRIGGDAYDVVRGCHHDAIEYATDGIARAIAPLLPLPPEAEG